MKIASYSISKNGLQGYRKSPTIWGYDKDDNTSYPLAYLRKPKWMCDKDWDVILNSISLDLMIDLEFNETGT
jgi:hypothetical protein